MTQKERDDNASRVNESKRQNGVLESAQLRSKNWQARWHHAEQFMKEIKGRCAGDSAFAAALRRSAGETLSTARGTTSIYRYLYGVPMWHDEKYFLVATLFGLNTSPSIKGDFGTTMRMVAIQSFGVSQPTPQAIEQTLLKYRRFSKLVEAQFGRIYHEQDGPKSGGGELAFHLRQMVRLAAAKQVGINWPLLLADLCFWDDLRRPVQDKWARNFYAPGLSESRTRFDENEPNEEQGEDSNVD